MENQQQQFARLFARVKALMKWDDAKADLWFNTENPLLGGCTPDHLIQIGRAHKLEQFIKAAEEENSL
jgi:hypothetical protein